MLRRPLAALAALGLILTPVTASATRVSPMIADLSPAGRGAVARIQMINDSPGDIPFEVLMMRGEISTDGKLEMVPADEDFLVFPTQILLKRNSRQIFRVQYIGEPELAKSEIYYMALKQIPVDLDPAVGNKVVVLVNFNVLLNVVPKGAEAVPAIRAVTPATKTIAPPEDEDAANDEAAKDTPEEAVKPETPAEAGATGSDEETEDGAPTAQGDQPTAATAEDTASEPKIIQGLDVLVGNDGNRYFLAGLSNWKISGQTTAGEPFEVNYEPKQAAKFIGAGVVAPGKERRFFLPLETKFDPSNIHVEIEIPKEEN